MATRSLRPIYFKYLAECFAKDPRLEGITVFVDYDVRFGVEIKGDHAVKQAHLAVPVGEAEVAMVVWGLRCAKTHSVQLRSGDSDTLVIGMMHAHSFAFPLIVQIIGMARSKAPAVHHVMHTQKVEAKLKTRGWSLSEMCLALVINGTDFVARTEFLYRISTTAALLACRGVGDFDEISEALSTKKSFHTVIRRILSWHYGNARTKLFSPPPPEPDSVVVMETAALLTKRTRPASGRFTGLADEDDIERGRKRVEFNMTYWLTLQGCADGISPLFASASSPASALTRRARFGK
jgi:hypothetical protein